MLSTEGKQFTLSSWIKRTAQLSQKSKYRCSYTKQDHLSPQFGSLFVSSPRYPFQYPQSRLAQDTKRQYKTDTIARSRKQAANTNNTTTSKTTMPGRYSHLFIEGLSLMPRHNDVLKSTNPGPDTILKVVASVSTVGWIMFGLISVVSLNARGRAGRWVPEWYLDSEGTRWAKLSVLLWWTCVVLFWPIIWVVYLVGITWRAIKRGYTKWKSGKIECDSHDGSEV